MLRFTKSAAPLLIFLCALVAAPYLSARDSSDKIGITSATQLPADVQSVLHLIKHGGPFPYSKDGSVFYNREQRLPPRPRGYYLEYTVSTPGARDRGARRIIAGRAGEYYYTEDHYQSFRRIVDP